MTIIKRCKFYTAIFIIASLFFLRCKEKVSSTTDFGFSNDLIHETSPYLLQHANNPVNWKAWNSDIFDASTNQNKLVLISIGYSSCHWCHVMERETFEDAEVAQLMNENFISIKVDREERPDVDEVYQRAIQLVNQSGGWPLNVIALPNGKPLYLGTYLPKAQWKQVLSKINKMYVDDPIKANEYADSLSKGIEELSFYTPSTEFDTLTKEALATGVQKWSNDWDLEFGGDKVNEKFMSPNAITFLLNYAILNNDDKTLKHVKNTLDKIANGGIFDHVGGGFYRYSTDPQWKVPHFEKMLYDNAQAISLYSKAYTVFKEPAYKDLVFESIEFLEREMKNPEGGYYATLNAESEGVEGKFYTWSLQELRTLLVEDFELFASYYAVNEQNVWQDNQYVLRRNQDDTSFADAHKITLDQLNTKKTSWKVKLLKAKEKRERPSTDDKIITSWNAMLIQAFTDAYASFGDALFLDKAKALHQYIKKSSYTNNQLLHSFKTGSTNSEGFLEDYAFMIAASIELYKVSQELPYLDFSKELSQTVLRDFSDSGSGMFTFNKDQELISKIVKTNDGDIASPNSVMAHNLFQLGHIDYKVADLNKSKTMLTTLLPMLVEYTNGYSNWGNLMLNITQPYFEIVVVGENSKELMAALQAMHIPNALIIGSTIKSELPLFKDRFEAGSTLIYVCQNSTCKLPVSSIEAALEQMKSF